jgi:hypothetical protein
MEIDEESVFVNYNSENDYVNTVNFYPNIWGNSYESFIPPTFALYFESEKRFVLFKCVRYGVKFKVEHSIVNRPDPFYLKVLKNPYHFEGSAFVIPTIDNKNFTLWFANAWLCKKNIGELSAVIPVMHVSKFNSYFPYSQTCSHKIYEHISDYEVNKGYVENYSTLTSEFILSIVFSGKKIPFDVILNEDVSVISHIKPIPNFISELVIEKAISNHETCPITLDLIEKETACVTSCFHVFEKESIATWLNDKKNESKCPVCKQQCIISTTTIDSSI